MPREESAADWALLPAEDARAFREFRETIDRRLDEYIPAGEPAALLQFPYDGNVGNHMMWVAAIRWQPWRPVFLEDPSPGLTELLYPHIKSALCRIAMP